MRQVPKMIVGRGRLARHLSYYFDQLEIPHISWGDSTDYSTILLAIPDDEIVGFIEKNPELQDKEIVHFSGSLSTDQATGFHPLMTFGEELYDLETYKKIPIIIEDDRDTLPELPNPRFSIKSENKALYHSLCVMSGNYSVLLWHKIFQDFEEKLGLPREAAFLYMEKVFQNIKENSHTALTGPLVRGDEKTIESHRRALKEDPYLEVYEGFVNAYRGANV